MYISQMKYVDWQFVDCSQMGLAWCCTLGISIELRHEQTPARLWHISQKAVDTRLFAYKYGTHVHGINSAQNGWSTYSINVD